MLTENRDKPIPQADVVPQPEISINETDSAMQEMRRKSENLALFVVGGTAVSCAITSGIIFWSRFLK